MPRACAQAVSLKKYARTQHSQQSGCGGGGWFAVHAILGLLGSTANAIEPVRIESVVQRRVVMMMALEHIRCSAPCTIHVLERL